MTKIALNRLRHSLAAIAAVALFGGCAGEAPVAPGGEPGLSAQLVESPNGSRAADLGSCANLSAPAGSKLAAHVYASGTQIYRWSGTAWVFVAPEAVLSADAGGNGIVGTHFAGPTWLSVSGSEVRGAVVDRCTPDANAIPWLLLRAVSATGPGIFHRVTFIQRVNTVGGLAPSDRGSFEGEVREVPYTAEYFFYRAK